jgi:signal transduction histidine kinase
LLRSASLRLALAFAALFVFSSSLLVGALWWTTSGYLDREINAVIFSEANALAEQSQTIGLPGLVEAVGRRVSESRDDKALYLLADAQLRPLVGNLPAWPAQVGRAEGGYEADVERNGQLRRARLVHFILPAGLHLLVGRDIQDRVALRSAIFDALLWGGLIAVLIGAFAGVVFRRLVITRVAAIGQAASAIVAGNLRDRVPVAGSGDEFDALAGTINQLLAQIERLIDGVRNVSNAIAHDLRTPLAETRAQLEELLRQRPPPGATFAAIEATVEDIDRLIGVFNALLRLAEIDSGVRRAGFVRVNLADVVRSVAELYQPAAEAKGVAFACQAASVTVDGDPSLLAQAIGNLVDNAVKYAPPGVAVAVAVIERGEAAEVVVRDGGPGIPDAEKPKVVERFYRGDASRSAPGVGLGLSLVQAVAALHGGRLVLADNHPGLAASLILPRGVSGARVE